ncbi:MAG TPA: sigma-70 family RNA polymerase sigma factor [Candidatus Paceibacterota bacterium]|nr:sigma-70 family RNA polymerase sigma factor [Candidatus Paceibacterota bacterium]
MEQKTDKELIENYLGGDEAAFKELVSRHMNNVYKFTYRYFNDRDKAEDATQETFVKAWKNIKKFDTDKKFITWLFAIAKNTCLDIIKKKAPTTFSKIEAESEMDIADMVRDESPLPDELAERSEKKEMVSRLLEQMPPDYRMVLFLRYNDHLKFREIAESLGESLNTVKSRHLRGLKMMKKLIGS